MANASRPHILVPNKPKSYPITKKGNAMTNAELAQFCLTNAGKVATGISVADKNKVVKGRIVAYSISAKGTQYILIEDSDKPKKNMPDKAATLPIPFKNDDWYCVVRDPHLGYGCLASSVKVINTTIEKVEESITDLMSLVAEEKEGTERRCSHKMCDTDWCKIKYMGYV